jgi:hypothetical protein
MGQQQLLLIVLGVIIVGIAIVVGINLFNANAEESAKDTLVSEGTNLGAMAQQFYKKPVALGGGGNSFNTSNGAPVQFTVPANLATSSVGPGAWAAVNTPTTSTITFTPTTGAAWPYSTINSCVVTVTPTSISSRIQ